MRTSSHWTWRLLRWCNRWQSPRRQKWFHKLRLPLLWTQLDPYGTGIITFLHGSELIWLWPWKRAKYNGNVWYSVDLAGGFPSLREIDRFWDGYFEACRAAALRDEAAREDVYF